MLNQIGRFYFPLPTLGSKFIMYGRFDLIWTKIRSLHCHKKPNSSLPVNGLDDVQS